MPTVTLTLIGRSPISNSSELFSCTTKYSNFVFLNRFLFELSCKNIHTHTNTDTLTLIGQCPISNSSELFPYAATCSSSKLIHQLFFESSCTQKDTKLSTYTDRHTSTDGHEYAIFAFVKPQL